MPGPSQTSGAGTQWLATVLKQVLQEVTRDRVVFQDFFSAWVITITAIKYIEGSVIPVVIHIVYIIFHLNFNAITFIIYTTLELLVPVFVS